MTCNYKVGAFQDILKSCLSFGGGLEDSSEEKWGGNRKKVR